MSHGWMKEQVERCSREVRGLAANDIALIDAAAAGDEEVVKILLDDATTLEGADMLHEKNAVWARGRKYQWLKQQRQATGQ